MMRRGLTLVELVLTIALAGILGIPTGLLLGEHLFVALTSRDSTVATQLARYEMERLDSLNNFFDPNLNVVPPVTISNYQGFPYDLTRTVTCLTSPATTCTSGALNNQGVKRIQVTVTKTGSAQPLSRLISYRTKHVFFGS